MNPLDRPLRAADRWQRRNAVLAVTYGVLKKFGDDQANLLTVGLGWYGFVAIYPTLLVVVTIFGYIGVASLGTSIVNTLQHFPVIGSDVQVGHGRASLHGNLLGLVTGIVGLLYGAQGVTQVAVQAMGKVWNVPQYQRPGFIPRLGRSFLGLITIGGAFVVSAFVGSFAVGRGHGMAFRALLIVAMAVSNLAFYFVAFKVLTPKTAISTSKELLPGVLFGAITFTLLTTVGTGLIEHQLRNSSATYGAFASIIGVVTYLLLVARLSIYGAELNPVLSKRLWPRALVSGAPTEADRRVLSGLAREQQRRPEERIGVDFASEDSVQTS